MNQNKKEIVKEMFSPVVKKFQRIQIQTHYKDDCWSIDLIECCPYDFHKILHSHSTPKGAPVCAKASKSYGLDVRNIVEISPKVATKQPFFDFFRFSQKLSIRFERNFLQLFYTKLESYMCNGIKIV